MGTSIILEQRHTVFNVWFSMQARNHFEVKFWNSNPNEQQIYGCVN